MIEEKMIISFTEYLSCFDNEGELLDGSAENAKCCMDAINEAVNRFIAGVSTIAHHGLSINGKNFHVEVYVSPNDADLRISCDSSLGEAMFCFIPKKDLVLTKSFNAVSIE